MKTRTLFLVLSSLLLLTGCQENEQPSDEKKVDSIEQATQFIDHGKYTQAKAALKEAKKTDKKKATILLTQIDQLQNAQQSLNNNQLTEAKKIAKQLIKNNHVDATVKDRAAIVIQECEEKEDQKEKEARAKKEKEVQENKHSEKNTKQKDIPTQIDEIVSDYSQRSGKNYQKMSGTDKPQTLGDLTLNDLTNGDIKMLIDGHEIPLSATEAPAGGYQLIAFYDDSTGQGASCNSLLFCIDDTGRPEILMAQGPGQAMMMMTTYFDSDRTLTDKYNQIMQ